MDKERLKLSELIEHALNSYKTDFQNDFTEYCEAWETHELAIALDSYYQNFEFGDFTDHIVEYYCPEENGSFLRIFKDNANTINDAYIEKCKEYCESDTDDDIFQRIQAGIWWKIRDALYQFDIQNFGCEVIETIAEERMRFFNHINAILPETKEETKRGKL